MVASRLKLESLAAEEPEAITEVDSGTISFGREPENHIVIDSTTISRRHACLQECGSQWILKDLGSTNGCWLNGVRVLPGNLRLVRDGDVIQLSDYPVRIREVSTRPTAASLIVLFGEKFQQEIPFEEDGSRFVIGGPEADLELEGASRDIPQAVLSRHNGNLELKVAQVGTNTLLNGMAAGGTSSLVDRDEVAVGGYRILVSEPSTETDMVDRERLAVRPSPQREPSGIYDRPNRPTHLQEDSAWESEAARRQSSGVSRKFVFGSPPDAEGTLSLQKSTFSAQSGIELSPAQRFTQQQKPDVAPLEVSDKLMIIIGFVVFATILGMIVYFAFA